MLIPMTVVVGGVAQTDCTRAARPNVILISIDCLNERQLEAAMADGSAPHLAALAAESEIFMHAHAHAPWTTPSHMSMLTGLYPRQHGRDLPWRAMIKANDYADREPLHPCLPTRLSAAGYETVAFVGKGSISAEYGLGRGFALYHESRRAADNTDLPQGIVAFRTWLVARGGRPFFLFFHTYDLHHPLRPDLHHPLRPDLQDARRAIPYIDGQIGTFLSDLKQHDLLDNSLLFLTGDHGSEMLTVPGRCSAHGAGHYEENLRVPLLMRVPHGRLKGRSDILARHIDILPTALDVLGLGRGDYRGEGLSLVRAVEGGPRPERSFSEADARCVQRFALVTERFKYIYAPRGPAQLLLRSSKHFYDRSCPRTCRQLPPVEELYDLARDPEERSNLLGPEADAEALATVARMRADLERHLNQPPQYRTRVVSEPQAPPPDRDLQDALRALGYLDGKTPTPEPEPAMD
jgi:arylsulfatase A-like enzyme